MDITPTSCLLTLSLAFPSAALAQEAGLAPPKPAVPARTDVELVSLQSLVGQTLLHDQAPAAVETAATRGKAEARPTSSIEDIVFGTDGSAQYYVVTQRKDVEDAPSHILPVMSVRWDASRRGLATTLEETQIAGLETFSPQQLILVDKPSIATSTTTALAKRRIGFLATELMAARILSGPTKNRVSDQPDQLWLLPTERRLAFLTVKVADKAHLVPWTLVLPRETDGSVNLEIPMTAERIALAPVLASAGSRGPGQALRCACYQHFGIPLPAWEAIQDVKHEVASVDKDDR